MSTPTVNPYTGFVTAPNPGTGPGVVTSYQLGPITAGADSFLGGLFGWANGLSRDYATGLSVSVNNPAAAAFVLSAPDNQHYTPEQAAALGQAAGAGLSQNPFTQSAQVVGSILGTGVAQIGRTVGITGHTAAPGVSSGAQQGTQGVTEVGAAGVSGAFGGAISGLGSGLSTTLAANAGNPSLIFVAAVVLVIILASK